MHSKKLLKVTILVAILLFICSLQAVSATTINSNSNDGISGGITATEDGGTLYLDPGVYNKIGKDNKITISKNITIRGNGPTKDVIIDAKNSGQIFVINGNVNVRFINITFINANTTVNGGVIFNNGGTLDIQNSVFSNNTARKGGAIYSVSGIVNINNCVFDRNKANFTTTDTYSGAIHQDSGSFTIKNTNFTNNSALRSGAMRIVAGTLIIDNCNFIENTADHSAGALYVYGGNVTIDNTNFIKNYGANAAGAIYQTRDSLLEITNTKFDNNIGGSWGGGAIYKDDDRCGLNIKDCNFTNNGAINGGAIYAVDNLKVIGSTFLDNINTTIYVYGGNITVNYNSIIDNNNDKSALYFNNSSGGNPNIDYNWWGNNKYDSNIVVNNYYIAKLTNTTILKDKKIGDTIGLRYYLVLNGTNDNTGVLNLPKFEAIIKNNGVIIKNISDARISEIFTIKLTAISNNFAISNDNNDNPVVSLSIIIKNKTSLSISTPTIYEGKKTTIKAAIKNSAGKALSGKKISININGKTYIVTTNSKGIATLQVSGLKAGKFKVRFNYAGDSNYQSSTATSTQTIKAKVDLAITSIKKVKTSNKKIAAYKVTIANFGSLKSKATTLKFWHVRHGKVIKSKYAKVKAISSGKKITLIVKYYPDRALHKYCKKECFFVNPKKTMNEISYKNNLKVVNF
ncbi:Ig-like domain repeat protein [Methanobrevibacter sp. TMH8]|uniref:Ig-like domain-containing protein n=1 Tax=Methanobrevibacter sp. TMH8 TaxID=2848611 RepID=UPI001CCD4294|nr:Ig-like domain-containing protein [Methanobrevibacter sp. TMH8]MBZ9570003.1 Ig-like domain repeat protein [Methanobrevibacter sp. TMH8]